MSRSRAWLVVLCVALFGVSLAVPAHGQDDDNPEPPYATTPPSISGTPAVGQTLTVTDATWSEPVVALRRDWQRCDGDECTSTGQTATTYAVTQADAGFTMLVVETAMDSQGQTSESTGSIGKYVDAPKPAEPIEPTSPSRKRPPVTIDRPTPTGAFCAPVKAGEQCGLGGNRKTAGGSGKVSHKGWPRLSGVLWKVLAGGRGAHRRAGTNFNDELLGHHGNDTIDGGKGKDIIWGDWDPSNNNASQHDVLRGGPGGDFIYPSHGTNRVSAGGGNDHVIAFYGRGTINCGSGHDTVQVRANGAYKLHGCETVTHF